MKFNTNDVKITFACEALNTETMPHKKWQNLNIVIYVPEKFYVTNDDLEENNISEEELFAIAEKNTNKDWVVIQFNFNDFFHTKVCSIDDINNTYEYDLISLTNPDTRHGAIAIYFKENLEKIAEKFDSDFYILPSSIHETIILPKNNFTGKSSFKDFNTIIEEVNDKMVGPEIRLSNNCYLYDRKLKQIIYQK